MRTRTNSLALALLATWSVGLDGRADWPLVRGDADATGVVTEPLKQPLEILWTYEADDSAFDATACIVDGIVYVGDVDGTFHAVKLDSGVAAWKKKFEDSGFIAGSAVVDGRIFCIDFNGAVRCLDVADGKEIWKVETESSLYAAPNVHESLVLIATDFGELRALDVKTGDQKWKFAIDQPLRCWPTVVGGRVLVAGCDGKLHAVDVANGEGVESIDIGGPADGMPAVSHGRVFFCTAGGVFHATTVNPLKSVWKYGQRGQGEIIHAAAVNDRAVVLGTHDKRVVALDPA
jgi:outer membrane protein assembly factor BamB